MEEKKLARIAYFVGMSASAAIMAKCNFSLENAEGLLKSIETSAQKTGSDIYKFEGLTVEEIKSVMRLINPNWR